MRARDEQFALVWKARAMGWNARLEAPGTKNPARGRLARTAWDEGYDECNKLVMAEIAKAIREERDPVYPEPMDV